MFQYLFIFLNWLTCIIRPSFKVYLLFSLLSSICYYWILNVKRYCIMKVNVTLSVSCLFLYLISKYGCIMLIILVYFNKYNRKFKNIWYVLIENILFKYDNVSCLWLFIYFSSLRRIRIVFQHTTFEDYKIRWQCFKNFDRRHVIFSIQYILLIVK